MDFADKLAGITLSSDTRITDADREFCKAHQKAYDEAGQILAELRCIWDDAIYAQNKTLDGFEGDYGRYSSYISESDFSLSKIEEKQRTIHNGFIVNIVKYFNDTYKVELSSNKILEFLIPKKPEYSWHHSEEYQEQYDEWEKRMDMLSLKYTDVLDQLLIQLDGRTFSEYALDELKRECHKMSWKTFDGTSYYQIKGNVITFKGGFCSESYASKWELYESSKILLPALGHFESGDLDYSASPLKALRSWVYDQQTEFDGWQKVSSLKMFKNGRLDIKFRSPEYANEFAEQYLGLVC